MSLSATARVLDRLQGVKQTRPGNWAARCPAHEDRSPSLSIREMEDGRVLLHCFSGCETGVVLSSMGLRMSDLFDRPLDIRLLPVRGNLSPREILDLVSHEITVAAILLTDAEGRTLTAEEVQRMRQASQRLGAALGMMNAG